MHALEAKFPHNEPIGMGHKVEQRLLSVLLRSEFLKVAKAEQVDNRYTQRRVQDYKILNMTETRVGGQGL